MKRKSGIRHDYVNYGGRKSFTKEVNRKSFGGEESKEYGVREKKRPRRRRKVQDVQRNGTRVGNRHKRKERSKRGIHYHTSGYRDIYEI